MHVFHIMLIDRLEVYYSTNALVKSLGTHTTSRPTFILYSIYFMIYIKWEKNTSSTQINIQHDIQYINSLYT